MFNVRGFTLQLYGSLIRTKVFTHHVSIKNILVFEKMKRILNETFNSRKIMLEIFGQIKELTTPT